MDNSEDPATQTLISPISIVGLVLAFLLPPIGLVLSIIALIQAKKNPAEKQGFAIAGIIISAVELTITFLLLTLLFFSAASTNTQLISYKNTDPAYTVQYPKDWQIERKNDGGAKSTIFKDSVDDTGLVRGQEEVLYISPETLAGSSDRLKLIKDSIKAGNKNFTIQNESRKDYKGNPSLTFVATYSGETGTLKGKYTIIQKPDGSIYAINTQAPLQNWDELQEAFYTIHNTFQP